MYDRRCSTVTLTNLYRHLPQKTCVLYVAIAMVSKSYLQGLIDKKEHAKVLDQSRLSKLKHQQQNCDRQNKIIQ